MDRQLRHFDRAVSCALFSLLLLALASAVACEPPAQTPDAAGPVCTEGTLDCPCLGDGTCISADPGSPLECVSGTCRPRTCAPGSLGCTCLDGFACYGNNVECNPDGLCQYIVCTAGTLGCPCTADEQCLEPGSLCTSGQLCVAVACRIGDEGCACDSDQSCGVSATGEPLTCSTDDHCVAATCAPGASGCVCRDGYLCLGSGDECRNGYCMASDCTAGSAQCVCAGGGCNGGLRCLANRICVESTGSTGGACDAAGHCLRGNRCQDAVCVPCSLGTQGCACSELGGCNDGLECSQNQCIATTGYALSESSEAHCYTPCSQGMQTDDGYRACSAEGLMEGCVDGLECVSPGQCVTPGASPRSCQRDIDCPQFHACLYDLCRSNCQTSDDCQGNAVCAQHVCRRICNLTDQPCPPSYFCSTDDGTTGNCLPIEDATNDSDNAPTVPFTVSTSALGFNSGYASGVVRVTNTSQATTTFTVRKLEHGWYDAQGLLEVTQLLVRDDTLHADLNACTAGTQGCRCRDSNGEQICAPLASGLAVACESGACHLPTCSAGDLGCSCVGSDCRLLCQQPGCPLWWLDIEVKDGDGAVLTSGQGVSQRFTLPPGESADIGVASADGTTHSWWKGQLEIDNGHLRQTVQLGYSQLPKGAWSGEIYYFGEFRVDETGLATWQRNGHQDADVAGIKNAFVQAWANFRNQRFSVDKFKALLTSTRTESWRSATLRTRCGPGRVCYPFLNTDGYEIYTYNSNENPVPSGVVEYPFAMNIEPDQGATYRGRIETRRALQYAGNPALTLRFSNDPAQCSVQSAAGCLVFVDALSAEIAVGGRFRGDDCGTRYESVSVPWLVPGFTASAEFDDQTSRYYRDECRDRALPSEPDNAQETAINTSLAGANPLADGRERRRSIELVDGALINTDSLFVIFRERIHSLLGDDPADDMMAYGYMVLQRGSGEPAAEDYQGNVPPTDLGASPTLPHLGCSADLLTEINTRMGAQYTTDVNLLANTLLGDYSASTSTTIDFDLNTGEAVHYLCEETDLFDKGRVNATADESSVPCPAGSKVTFFSADQSVITQAAVDDHSCRNYAHDSYNGCKATLQSWQREGRLKQNDLVRPMVWKCSSGNQAYCSEDRYELRKGKTFFAADQPTTVAFLPLRSAVSDGFRYRTRFQNRQGSGLGFVPSICIAGGDTVPYCYDPDGITAAQQRIDCLLDLYVNHYTDLDTNNRGKLNLYLVENFSYSGTFDPDLDVTVYHSGFEKLQAELLIMLGDDSFTKALASRFDLAGLNIASFEGSKLEPNGINLSGVAGAEMYNLYQAAQYFTLALDRFFDMYPLLQQSLDSGLPAIVGQETVVEFFGRLIRASTQKVRAFSEISKRYQNFNRPDLARLVIERGYTAAYLESIILTNLMQQIGDQSRPENVAQIVNSIQQAQISYRVALTDMREQYDAITEEINYFGYAPDYIPFPATESAVARDNAFEVLDGRAWQRLQLAQQAEDLALSTARSFDTDAASFQSELIRVENNYEGQLADLCGTFTVQGQVYPAIRKYAYLDPKTQLFGDPCGLMGTGQIHESMGALDLELIDIQRVRVSIANTDAEARIERNRLNAVCNTVDSFHDTYFSLRGRQNTIEHEMDILQATAAELDRAFSAAQTFAQLAKCSVGVATDCPTALGAVGMLSTFLVINEVAQVGIRIDLVDRQDRLRSLQKQEGEIQFEMQCNDQGDGINQIDSRARVATLLLRKTEQEVEALRAQYELQQAISHVQQQRQQARRIQAEMEEMQQQTINVEAARNNPNVRIYRNDAVINADVTFYAALREVYKATRVFEYYTSQSYAKLDQLFLVRMITRGDYNLQNYLIELEDAFRDFEDQYGQPDMRVTRLSLRDDIMRIPTLTVTGEPLTQSERISAFRERLKDPALLDENGYITIPFSTAFDELSPLTRNHKIKYVQAQIIGSDYGDQTARVYLRARGTSAVSSVGDEILYYTFPERTAVINAFFLDQNAFDSSVYRCSRFTDRPYINSRYEFVLNMLDEQANQDISLDGLTDIRLYLYYTDFTVY